MAVFGRVFLPVRRMSFAIGTALFLFLACCRRLHRVLLYSQLDDPLDQVVGNRLIQGKLEIALRSSVACDGFLKCLVAGNRWIKSDMLVPGSKVDQYPVQLECG